MSSLMKKYLTNEVKKELQDKKTAYGYTLDKLINSGLKNPDSSIGVYAGDKESYDLFSALMDPIIQEYHKFSGVHKSDLSPFEVGDFDNPLVISTRVRVGRNLADFPLGTNISKEQRLEVEKKVKDALSNLTCKGTYYSLENLSDDEKEELVKEHFLFKQGDRFLKEAGLNNDWPSGRGIFLNDDKTFLVWINEEDQLRIISMQKGGNLSEVYNRLVKYIKELENTLNFLYHEKYGYITSCPTNLGTAMRASVHVKLEKLSKDMDKLNQLANNFDLQIRGIDGEHSNSKDGIFDISNKRRLGVSEKECIETLFLGIKEILKEEAV
ncbi:phosphagen kinase [Sulfurospirillum sp. 1307]